MSEATFNVRLFQPEDLAGILKLWEDHSGWGGITEQQWQSWYMNTPWGESVVVVVEDLENQIVGQGILTPFPFKVDHRSGLAYRISAPILMEEVRAGRVINPNHPSRRMLDVGVAEVRARGGVAAYAMPLISWRGFFRRIPGFHVQEYGCARIDLDSNTTPRDPELKVEVCHSFGIEHSDLWQDAVAEMPIYTALERTEALWNYRLRGKLVLNIKTSSGDLVGYVAIKRESGLLLDMLARNDRDLKLVIRAAVGAIQERPDDFGTCPNVLKLMVTPRLEPIVQDLDCQPDDFRFLFTVVSTKADLEPENIEPVQWYLTAGD
ncbi:MAG: hypothetical protein ACKOYH_10225 [Cyanobium sp.]